VQLLCFVATDRVVPFPSDKAQQMGPSGLALRVFQADPHSLLRVEGEESMDGHTPSKSRPLCSASIDCEPAWKT